MEKNEIVINGRAQVVEILKRLPEDHKNKLLKSLKTKNSSLAQELTWQTLTFDGIAMLTTTQLSTLLEYISSPIISIAVADLSADIQRKFLSSLSRQRAKEVFANLKNNSSSVSDSKKAKAKVVDIATTLMQKKILDLT